MKKSARGRRAAGAERAIRLFRVAHVETRPESEVFEERRC